MGLAADCERLADGLLAQPVNTLSSLAYLAAGVAVAAPALRAAPPRRAERLTCAAVVAMNGVGGSLFHGGLPAGRAVHDGALLATLLFVVTHGLGLARHWTQRRSLTIFAAGAAGLAAAVLTRPGLTNAAAVVLVCGAVAAEVAVLRAGGPAVPAALALLACAAVLNLVSRAGGPLCRPDALVQGHAAWHVLTAAALWAWGRRRLGVAPPAGPNPFLPYPGGWHGQPGDVGPGPEDGAPAGGVTRVSGGWRCAPTVG